MREPNPREISFAAAAQRARLTKHTAALVSQRSEERLVFVDIEAADISTSGAQP